MLPTIYIYIHSLLLPQKGKRHGIERERLNVIIQIFLPCFVPISNSPNARGLDDDLHSCRFIYLYMGTICKLVSSMYNTRAHM